MSSDEQIIRACRAPRLGSQRLAYSDALSANFPLELEAILKETRLPRKKSRPRTSFVDNGEPTLMSRERRRRPEASLILNRDNRIFGNDYRDASGFFRVTPQHEGNE